MAFQGQVSLPPNTWVDLRALLTSQGVAGISAATTLKVQNQSATPVRVIGQDTLPASTSAAAALLPQFQWAEFNAGGGTKACALAGALGATLFVQVTN